MSELRPLRVLVACEESQVVCKAFRARGHEAYSCDLQSCSGGHPEWHIKGDVWMVLFFMKWDLIVMHPPCTAICTTGNRSYGVGKPKQIFRLKSAIWTQELFKMATNLCSMVCMENPKGVLNGLFPLLPKPQYIQPYQFGHKCSKMTGLWLYGLPKLIPTHIVEPEWITSMSGKRHSKIHWENPSTNNPENAKLRSKTFPGIANAMASQWSPDLSLK